MQIFNTGHEEPDYGGSGGAATEFYKCSYVNSDSWGGYKAVFRSDKGRYEKETALTVNLPWTSVQPHIGGVYTGDALAVLESLYGLGFPFEPGFDPSFKWTFYGNPIFE